MEDSEIVELYLSRDESAIARTAEKYGARLRRIADNVLHSEAMAEECENDTYLEAWNRIPPNEPRDYLFAFLGKIVRHLAIDQCRKQASQKRFALFCELTQEMEQALPGGSNAEEALEADALSRSINAFLGTCSRQQRDYFVRRYWFFEPVSGIANRYGVSRNRVNTALFRMRERLKRYLEKEGYVI